MIMRIWKHIRKYWFYIVCSLIFAALSVASQLYVPILTGNAIDPVSYTHLTLPTTSRV